jgi:hypothetical protein
MVSASGVSVDVAPGPSQEEQDFRAIYQGGENFLARAKALSDLKGQHELAYANLRVGQEARAALDAAQLKQSAANEALAKANATLESATQTATDIVAKAREEAATIVAEARTAASAISASASQTMLNANDYSSQKKSAADAALKRAADHEAETARLKADGQAALAAHQARQADADQAGRAAAALATAVMGKISDIRKTLGELVAQ